MLLLTSSAVLVCETVAYIIPIISFAKGLLADIGSLALVRGTSSQQTFNSGFSDNTEGKINSAL